MNLNSKRLSTYFKYQMTDDVGLEEVVDCGYVKKRDKDVIFTSHDWVLMEIYTNIQFIKGFHLVNLLSSNDLMYFLKNSYFKCAIYFIAVRSYLENVESMTFPFNVDVFPEEISQVSSYNPILLNRVRCRLISKFIDFRLTQEELLLSVAIIFCDPYASGLSKDAQNVISQYQNIYTSTLMRLCFQTKQNSGPERFANILSLSQTLTKTIEELSYVVELFKLHQPGLPMRKLVKDSF
uniref:NR LBD domain-containing protein n=2 Tax=Caenorhabditis tropicalis TaxID=1561998 RepID=A0A1I7V3H0_9PELO